MLAVIVAKSEIELGFNICKSGPSSEWKKYPGFGKYVAEKEMTMFVSEFIFMWYDREYFYQEKLHITQGMFMPPINGWNAKMIFVLIAICLILDESMSACWRKPQSIVAFQIILLRSEITFHLTQCFAIPLNVSQVLWNMLNL